MAIQSITVEVLIGTEGTMCGAYCNYLTFGVDHPSGYPYCELFNKPVGPLYSREPERCTECLSNTNEQ